MPGRADIAAAGGNRQRRKVFGIGCPKTGTKSLGLCFRILGLRNTSWNAELAYSAIAGNQEPALRFAAQYDSFDDAPWCLIYEELDRRFPESKFVLTVRRDSTTWLKSFRAHNQIVMGVMLDEEGRRPPGCTVPVWPDGVAGYERHNDAVRAYFRNRPGDLLEICWDTGVSWDTICDFLEFPVPDVPLPHENRTDYRESRLMHALLGLERHLPRNLQNIAKRVRRPLARLLRHALGRK